MANDGDAGGTDEPQNSGEGRRPQSERDGDDGQGGVKLRGGRTPRAQLEIVAFELANAVHASDDEDDNKEKQQVSEQAVDAEHSEDGSIVAGEVAQVVVDAALGLAEVGGLGDALEVEELANGAQVGEARRDGGGAQAIEAAREVHPRRQGGDGDVEARHGGCERVARPSVRSGGGGGGSGGLGDVRCDECLVLFCAFCRGCHVSGCACLKWEVE